MDKDISICSRIEKAWWLIVTLNFSKKLHFPKKRWVSLKRVVDQIDDVDNEDWEGQSAMGILAFFSKSTEPSVVWWLGAEGVSHS